jgi:hypothetical protein
MSAHYALITSNVLRTAGNKECILTMEDEKSDALDAISLGYPSTSPDSTTDLSHI